MHLTEKEQKARKEGFDAQRRGEPFSANPYRDNFVLDSAWVGGYDMGIITGS